VEYKFEEMPEHVSDAILRRTNSLEICCSDMIYHLNKHAECIQHGYACPDRPVDLCKSGDFVIRAPNGNYSIQYCPWCGKQLSDKGEEEEDDDV